MAGKKEEGFTAPSWQQYMRFMQNQGKAQVGAFDPMINMYMRLLGNMPTAKGVGKRYDTEAERVKAEIRGLAPSTGGKNVTSTISALGNALGMPAGPAMDIAKSGNVTTGDDVLTKVLTTGVDTNFNQQKASAEQAARDARMQAMLGIAELRGKKKTAKASSMINPLQAGMDWLKWRNAYTNFSGGGGVTPPPPPDTPPTLDLTSVMATGGAAPAFARVEGSPGGTGGYRTDWLKTIYDVMKTQ